MNSIYRAFNLCVDTEEQILALQNSVQQLTQAVATIQANNQGPQQGQAAIDPAEQAAESLLQPEVPGVAEQQEATAGEVVVIDSPRDVTFLKQLTKSLKLPKVVDQNVGSFIKFTQGLSKG